MSQISTHPNGFIGDLEIGKRTENDTTVRVITFIGDNGTNLLQTFNLARITVPNSEFSLFYIIYLEYIFFLDK